MPALAAVPWQDVETMIRAGVGVRETARRLGLDVERIKRQATRKGWAAAAPAARLAAAVSTLATVRAEVVPNVPTAAQALADTLADDSKASRLAGSRYARRTLEHAAQLDPDDALQQAQNVKAVVASAALVHAWEAKAAAPQIMVNLALLGVAPEAVPYVDVQASTVPVPGDPAT